MFLDFKYLHFNYLLYFGGQIRVSGIMNLTSSVTQHRGGTLTLFGLIIHLWRLIEQSKMENEEVFSLLFVKVG